MNKQPIGILDRLVRIRGEAEFWVCRRTGRTYPSDTTGADKISQIWRLAKTNASAKFAWGWLLVRGELVPRNRKAGLRFLEAAADAGVAEAAMVIGICWADGLLGQVSYRQAVSQFKRAAAMGLAQAQLAVGICYESGIGVRASASAAARWLLKAADAGDADAQFELAVKYDIGRGVQRNVCTAVSWYRRAAVLGHPHAQYNLAKAYESGVGVRRSMSRSMYWLRRAATQGLSDAQVDLGFYLREGRHALPNVAKANRLTSAAAMAGDPIGLHNLAVALSDARRHREAQHLMVRAVLAGSLSALAARSHESHHTGIGDADEKRHRGKRGRERRT